MAKLYNWHLTEQETKDYRTEVYAHGVVTGHKYLDDATFVHTSAIQHILKVDNKLIIQTKHSEYDANLSDMSLEKYSCTADILNHFFRVKIVKPKAKVYSTEENSTLLVLGNSCQYYFNQAISNINSIITKAQWHPHIGMFQNSVLINNYNAEIDLAYFPYKSNQIEFYCWRKPENQKVFVENCGDSPFYITLAGLTYQLEIGDKIELFERK